MNGKIVCEVWNNFDRWHYAVMERIGFQTRDECRILDRGSSKKYSEAFEACKKAIEAEQARTTASNKALKALQSKAKALELAAVDSLKSKGLRTTNKTIRAEALRMARSQEAA